MLWRSMPVDAWHSGSCSTVNGIRACAADGCLIPYAVTSSVVTAIGLGVVSGISRTNPFCCLAEPRQALLCGSSLAAVVISVRHVGLCPWSYRLGGAPCARAVSCLWRRLAVLVLREPVSTLQLMAVGLAAVGVVLVQNRMMSALGWG